MIKKQVMPQYIDKAAVKAEIANLQATTMDKDGNFYTAKALAEYNVLCMLESFLDTLEVKEVDLEKKIDSIWNPRFNLGWDEKSLLTINHEGFTNIAKHFYELGLNEQKNK